MLFIFKKEASCQEAGSNLPAACVAKKDEIQQKMSVSQHFSAVFFK